jgi:hypothetical protein
MKDLFPASPQNGPANKPQASSKKSWPTLEEAMRAVAAEQQLKAAKTGPWIYQDQSGKPVMAVGRFLDRNGEKTYRPFHLLPDWTWTVGDPPGLLPLYDLPALFKCDRGRTVFVVEGEQCVLAMKGIHAVATTSSHGAESPHKTDWLPLAGRAVAILPDNDASGEGYLVRVLRLLKKLDPRPLWVKVVRLPGLAAKQDVADWIPQIIGNRVGDAARQAVHNELQALVDAAPLVDLDTIESDSPGRPSKREGEETRESRDGEKRPEIEVTTERHIVTGLVLAELANNPRVYVRGDQLVIAYTPTESTEKLQGGIVDKQSGNARIRYVVPAICGCLLTEACKFWMMKCMFGEWKPSNVHPPDWLIAAVLAAIEYPGFRPLESLASCPFVDDNGQIVTASGYHEPTKTLVSISCELDEIPDQITAEHLAEAHAGLSLIMKDFPFESGKSFTVWLAALLTAIQRPMIRGPVPGLAMIGNKAGCGKQLAIDIIGYLVFGGPISTFSYPRDTIEADKVKLALALNGIQAVHLDNLDEGSTYGNSGLDSALTSTVVGGRVLGESREVEGIPLRPWCSLSGNNLSSAKDAYRRWLPCHLVSPLERPYEREGVSSAELLEYVQEYRGTLLTHALTILVAHARAGRPTHGFPLLGSFEEWDGIVRAAILYPIEDKDRGAIVKADCLQAQREMAEGSPDALRKAALIAAWEAEVPTR